MDRIINSSVNWTANSKTRDRKYYFAFIREDETPLYGYIGDNYTKVDLNKYKFFAGTQHGPAPGEGVGHD